jgi:phasin
MPRFEIPAVISDLAEKGGTQAKENWAKMKATTDEMTGMVEATYAAAAKGTMDYGLQVIEMTRVNANAAFDFIGKFVAVKSPSEAIELSTAHARLQFDTVSAQNNEILVLAQKIATDAVEPIKIGMARVLQREFLTLGEKQPKFWH